MLHKACWGCRAIDTRGRVVSVSCWAAGNARAIVEVDVRSAGECDLAVRESRGVGIARQLGSDMNGVRFTPYICICPSGVVGEEDAAVGSCRRSAWRATAAFNI